MEQGSAPEIRFRLVLYVLKMSGNGKRNIST
jgi:hypothetical protein